MNKYELFQRVALARDFPAKHLRRGDVATIVDCHRALPGGEPAYSLEVFNAIGETIGEAIAVIVVDESEIQPLRADEALNVRAFAIAV
ncbi:MAG: DUF4926 domain-containing protein [bacterium]